MEQDFVNFSPQSCEIKQLFRPNIPKFQRKMYLMNKPESDVPAPMFARE